MTLPANFEETKEAIAEYEQRAFDAEQHQANQVATKQWLERELTRVKADIEGLVHGRSDFALDEALDYKSEIENRLYVQKGDTATITHKGLTYTGEVLSSSRYDEMYYIEMNVKSGTAPLRGYTYWKQSQDGGTVSKEYK